MALLGAGGALVLLSVASSTFSSSPPTAAQRPPSQQAFPEARVAFAGDWLSPEEGETYACVETALGSGLAAAEQILRAEAEEAEASGRAAPKL